MKKIARTPSAKKNKIKQLTIRYDSRQEIQIELMKQKMGMKTSSKAFLNCPRMIESQHQMILGLKKEAEDLHSKIAELQEIVDSFTQFSQRMEQYLEGKNGKNGKSGT